MNLGRYYSFLYRYGLTPWDRDTEDLAGQLRPLLDREGAERTAAYGRALDLGCGTGRWSVELAARGWHVTSIDVVARATAAARRRAHTSGLELNVVRGDVTALRAAGVGPGFSFFLDVECFHHLNDSQRLAMGREVNAVASADATMLLLGWVRARRGLLPPGVNEEDLTTALPGWEIIDERPYEGTLQRSITTITPRWYRLARS